MRWLLIDEFVYIKKGAQARGRRMVNRAEGALEDVYPSAPLLSSSFLVEMMAQVTGVLVGASIDFKKEVVLARVSDAEFPQAVWAPSELVIDGKIESLAEDAAVCEAVIRSGDKTVAKGIIFFGLFDFEDSTHKSSSVFSEDFMGSFGIRQLIDGTR